MYRKKRKDAPLLRDLIKDTLPSIEEDEEEEKKNLAPGEFELGTSRLRGCCSNHIATTIAHLSQKLG